MSVGKVMLRGEAEGQGLSARAGRCLTSSLSSSPIGLSRPAPPAPGIPAYAGCCCFFSGLLGGMVVSGVFLFVQSSVWNVTKVGREQTTGQRTLIIARLAQSA
jgi:hypothetical protein